ncbi:MAG: hypothetical protein A2X49_06960 [Lentisphaerae bacterium GWF2_52_8]|nr:MAG: hypothetical protein A2X49_06960 [Lentisphaerae bacterium GWF2_52_8]
MPDLTTIQIERQKHPGISALNPFDIGWEYEFMPNAGFRGDMHYALQIGIVIHGKAEIIFDSFSRVYTPGEIWWTMCWEPHAYRLLGRRNFILVINIDIDNLGNCGPFPDCHWLTPFTAPPDKRFCPSSGEERKTVKSLAQTLFHLCWDKPLNWHPDAWLRIHQFILHAIAEMNRGSAPEILQNASGFSRIKAALNMVQETDARPPSLADAAKACSLSASRFSELFRRNMGVSFGKFAARVRMAHAAKDLLAGTKTIEEIAAKWGFFDSCHFCNSFKKFYKHSPRQFLPGKKRQAL